jgi:hypothetical protein
MRPFWQAARKGRLAKFEVEFMPGKAQLSRRLN